MYYVGDYSYDNCEKCGRVFDRKRYRKKFCPFCSFRCKNCGILLNYKTWHVILTLTGYIDVCEECKEKFMIIVKCEDLKAISLKKEGWNLGLEYVLYYKNEVMNL